MADGFVYRYDPDPAVDGLPPGEGVFLLCTFWLADCLALLGRYDDARRTFERLLSIRNDVGLLSELYDPQGQHCWAISPGVLARRPGEHGLEPEPGRTGAGGLAGEGLNRACQAQRRNG